MPQEWRRTTVSLRKLWIKKAKLTQRRQTGEIHKNIPAAPQTTGTEWVFENTLHFCEGEYICIICNQRKVGRGQNICLVFSFPAFSWILHPDNIWKHNNMTCDSHWSLAQFLSELNTRGDKDGRPELFFFRFATSSRPNEAFDCVKWRFIQVSTSGLGAYVLLL